MAKVDMLLQRIYPISWGYNFYLYNFYSFIYSMSSKFIAKKFSPTVEAIILDCSVGLLVRSDYFKKYSILNKYISIDKLFKIHLNSSIFFEANYIKTYFTYKTYHMI